jgi:hypothetical protein
VTLRFTRWRERSGRAVPLALVAALIALPVAASANEAAPAAGTQAKTSHVTLRQAAAREAAKTAPARSDSTRRAEQSNPSRQSTAFFKTKPGAIALVVMGLGTGYALYSTKHDRITSPAKQ